MRDERGFSIIWVLVGFALLVAAVFATCDAMWDDEDEVDDLGQGVELVAGGDDNRGGRNKNGRECADTEDCSSFSPSFEDSPIIVCVQPDSCRF